MDVRLAAPEDRCFDHVAEDVFDHAVEEGLLQEFLEDPRHHIAVAIAQGRLVGFASAVHYVHPDKPPELWVNEVGVTSAHRRSGLGRRLLDVLFDHGRSLGCAEAWVLTERGNAAANGLYRTSGARESPDDVVMYSWNLID